MSGDGAPNNPGRSWSIPSWRRIGDFFVTVAQLERSYQSLKASNDQLRDELKRLQRDVDRHSGQLDVLMTFVQRALDERTTKRSITDRSDPPADDR